MEPEDIAVLPVGKGLGTKGTPAPHGEIDGLLARGQIVNLHAVGSRALPNQLRPVGSLDKAGFAAWGENLGRGYLPSALMLAW